MRERWGIAFIGEAIGSPAEPAVATGWLPAFATSLDHSLAGSLIAPVRLGSTDEVHGLLRSDADPLRTVMLAGLSQAAPPMRWAVIAGRVKGGTRFCAGPVRTGRPDPPALAAARAAVRSLRGSRDRLVIRSGDPGADALLDDLAPVLGGLLADLSDRQRHVARLALVEGLRQAEIAHRLGVSRATVSVMSGRGRIQSLERLARAVRSEFARGVESTAAASQSG